MKKIVFVFLAVGMLISCDEKKEVKKEAPQKEITGLKLAFVDTKVLMDSCQEAKDLNSKFEQLVKTKGASLDAQKRKFENEVIEAEKSAQQMGPQWVQAKMQEFQKKEQALMQNEQKVSRDIQEQTAREMDTLVKKIKKTIKDYAKENNYDYIYGTGETSSILYGKEESDLTNTFIKIINDNYKKDKSKK